MLALIYTKRTVICLNPLYREKRHDGRCIRRCIPLVWRGPPGTLVRVSVLGTITVHEYAAGACKHGAEMLADQLLENAA